MEYLKSRKAQRMTRPYVNVWAPSPSPERLVAEAAMKAARTRATEIDQSDLEFRLRWECILAVDDLVAAVVEATEDVANNTVILFTSDHGFQLGQFRLPQGPSLLPRLPPSRVR